MCKCPVTADTNRYYSEMADKEAQWEADRPQREHDFDVAKEDLFFEEAMDFKTSLLSESEVFDDEEVEESLCRLYQSLPTNGNGRRPVTGLTHSERCSWALVEAVKDHPKMQAYLGSVLEARGFEL